VIVGSVGVGTQQVAVAVGVSQAAAMPVSITGGETSVVGSVLSCEHEPGRDDDGAESKNFRFQMDECERGVTGAVRLWKLWSSRRAEKTKSMEEKGAGWSEQTARKKPRMPVRSEEGSPSIRRSETAAPDVRGTLLAFSGERAGTHPVSGGAESDPADDRHV